MVTIERKQCTKRQIPWNLNSSSAISSSRKGVYRCTWLLDGSTVEINEPRTTPCCGGQEIWRIIYLVSFSGATYNEATYNGATYNEATIQLGLMTCPTCLFWVKSTARQEILHILMVSVDGHREFSTFQEMAPHFWGKSSWRIVFFLTAGREQNQLQLT